MLKVFREKIVFDHQAVHVCCHKASKGMLRRTHDRFPSDVETRVYDHRTSRQLIESSHHTIEATMAFPINGLDSCRIVDMRNSRHFRSGDRHPKSQVWILQSSQVFCVKGYAPIISHRRYQEHVGAVLVRAHFKDGIYTFPQNTGRKRAERFAELDFEVHRLLHARRAGVSDNTPTAKRARSVFHTSLKPSDNLFLG